MRSAMVSIFSRSVAASGYRSWKVLGSSAAAATISANSMAHLPPSTKVLQPADRTPRCSASSRMARCSDGWSPGKALMATTGVTPWIWMFSTCLRRFAAPASTSSGSSVSSSGGSGLPATTLYFPECTFSARTVATITAASGARPDVRHLMLKNRSAPMSAPNPASVTTKSPAWMPIMSARTDDAPLAMLPNGPAWTSTGVFSSVWRRFGLTASSMSTVMAPPAWRESAEMGRPSLARPITMRPSRCRMSWSEADRASTAITSDAAGLADRDDGALSDLAERVAEAHGGRRLALAERRGRDGRNHDVLRLRPRAQLVDRRELDLGDVVAIGLEQVRADAHPGRDLRHRQEPRPARDVEVARKRHRHSFIS